MPFHKGDRVQPSAKGIRKGIKKKRGTVATKCQYQHLVAVQWVGRKSAILYELDLIKHARKDEPWNEVSIDGHQAHFLLFALDKYLGVDAHGHIMSAKHGYTREELQQLRDCLFAAHEHPPGKD